MSELFVDTDKVLDAVGRMRSVRAFAGSVVPSVDVGVAAGTDQLGVVAGLVNAIPDVVGIQLDVIVAALTLAVNDVEVADVIEAHGGPR